MNSELSPLPAARAGVRPSPTRSPDALRRSALACALVCAAVLLSACGSTPRRDADEATAPAPETTAPAVTRRSGGGYYKDDGPDEEVPDNLDAIPDAEPRDEPLHRFANRPYHVMGQSFVPATELRPFRQRGHASWYGRRFHGNPTSSGEPYDMYAMTAAHPTLPIPSYARVTHLGNGRSVVVRVNDRGPFLRGRVIDLSYAAAHKLGYINAGSAQVEVEQILPNEAPLMAATRKVPPLRARANEGVVAADTPRPEARALAPLAQAAPAAADATASASAPTTLSATSTTTAAAAAECDSSPACGAAEGLAPPVASASGGIFLQLGAFSSYANAEGFRDTVQGQAGSLAKRFELFADGERFRLHAGPYDSMDDARNAAERMGTLLKLRPFVIVR
ncbi:septal ring lytic transglycosylase RlpA family protein [Thauera sp.]|jgi:rare lipoprotein A|uniref:septal ring lytic transglycosylase RlpA family protein n=1 Tax=Thauera sp. TaxID=1905334 RepID=UPI002A36E49F|nr:septal ring lytic transglycosylase RlpA family protein [Thauera sp.]MDX9886134.1 septal ring lytic transglycosylase RlpA family protein [Thauera sp.]